MATENTEAASDNFAEWLAHEMPPGTVINNPRWWAPRIAAHFAAGQQGKAGGVAGVFDSVRENLRFFADCAEDGDGCPLPRHWFDALTTIGLLERTKRSPAEWMMTSAGHDLLASPPAHPPDVEASVPKPCPYIGRCDCLGSCKHGFPYDTATPKSKEDACNG